MSQSKGLIDAKNPTFVCRLHKSLYGLRQVPRAWYDRLCRTLYDWGFHNSKSDSCLFIFQWSSDVLWVFIYVDNILVIGSRDTLITQFIQRLNRTFLTKGPWSCIIILGY